MIIGYQRLQALIRSRILTHQFKHLRGHIVSLQARCRGYLIRKSYRERYAAAVKIQAFIRGIIARNHFVKLREEYRVRMEALKLKEKEEAQLSTQMNPKKAKEIAEQKYNERLKEMEERQREEEAADKLIVRRKEGCHHRCRQQT